jgi:hypothetical protein
MSSRDRLISEIVAMAEELCDTHRHTEPIYETDHNRNRKLTTAYTTTQDGLLKQLREVSAEGLKVGNPTRSGGKPSSKPPGVFEALSAHVYIAVEAERWCNSVGIDPRRTPEESIRGLVGKAANLEELTLTQLHREVRFWHGQASVLTGWQLSAYTPPVPCPNCQRQASIRFSLETKSAFCSNRDRGQSGELLCGASWSSDEVTELGNYVRRMTEDVLALAS